VSKWGGGGGGRGLTQNLAASAVDDTRPYIGFSYLLGQQYSIKYVAVWVSNQCLSILCLQCRQVELHAVFTNRHHMTHASLVLGWVGQSGM